MHIRLRMSTVRHIRTVVLEGMTQDSFAKSIGRPQPTVSRWEKGELYPDIRDLQAIRALVDLHNKHWSPDWFTLAEEPAA